MAAKGLGKWTVARRVVQAAMLALFSAPLAAAGWGLLGLYAGTGADDAGSAPAQLPAWGSLSSSQVLGVDLLDPFAALQVLAAAREPVAALLWALPVLVVYALVRGRAFCGWTCPVNLVLEFTDWLRVKIGLRVSEAPVPRWVKPVAAAAVLVLSALTSIPLFEAVSPVGLFTRGLLFGSVLGVWTFTAILVAELFWARRVWCRALCPLGGFWQTVGTVGLLSVKIDHDACTHCGLCRKRCICDPAILDAALAGEADRVTSGDCMLCGKCVDACPASALKIGPALPKRPTL